MSDRCYICGEDNPNVLQTHHLIPRRYGGSDQSENLVRLCANCHQAIESLYDDEFFDWLMSWGKESAAAEGRLRDAVSSFVSDEMASSDGQVGVPPRGSERRGEIYEEYVNYCENRKLPMLTSQTEFFDTVEAVATGQVARMV